MPVLLVHLFGMTLLAGRVLHAYGLGSDPQIILARVWGMYLTLAALGTTALANIGMSLF